MSAGSGIKGRLENDGSQSPARGGGVVGAATTVSGEVARLAGEVESVAAEVGGAFGRLSARQLNWKPDASSWSVGQCLDHLFAANEKYLPVFERIARGERPRMSAWQRFSPLSGFFGRLVARVTAPEAKRKLKSPRVFAPTASDVRADIVARFVEQQRRLAALSRASASVDASKLIISSPVSPFVTYSLLDALRIIVGHERRHFAQARRVTQSEGFPAA